MLPLWTCCLAEGDRPWTDYDTLWWGQWLGYIEGVMGAQNGAMPQE